MRAILETFSNWMYQWLLNQRGDCFKAIWKNGKNAPDGMMWTLVFVICVSLLTAFVYYVIFVKNDANNDKKKNFIMFFVIGYVALVTTTIVGLPLVISKITMAQLFTLDTLKVCLLNIAYYSLFLELWCLLLKDFVHSNMDVLTLFK